MSALPNGWAFSTVGEITLPIVTTTPADTPETEFKYLDISAIDNQMARITSPKTYLGKDAPSRARQVVAENDTLFSTVRTYLKNIAIVPKHLDGEVASTGFAVLRPATFVDPKFLFHYTLTTGFLNPLADLQRGTSYPAVREDDVRSQSFPLPPFPEQRRIVGKVEELFSELDEGVANLKQARAQLAVYRQALLKHAFEGHLTADWRTLHAPELESADQLLARIRAEMPDNSKNSAPDVSSSACGWLELSLSDITKESLIGLVRSSDLQNQEGRGFCYIKMDRVDMSGHVDIEPKVFVDCSEEEVERFALRQGDILFNTRNSVELVGKTGLVRKPPPGPTVFNNNLMRIRLVSPVLPSFLNYQMCAPDFRNAMEQVKKATTSVAAVYGKDLWPLRIAIPSTREQQAIVDKLDSQLDVVESMEADIDLNLQKAEALRQSILKKAFAGELVPQDPADEPAAALLARIRAERDLRAARPENQRNRRQRHG